jgi:hypothetical protein
MCITFSRVNKKINSITHVAHTLFNFRPVITELDEPVDQGHKRHATEKVCEQYEHVVEFFVHERGCVLHSLV